MRCYINPTGMTKSEWLDKNAVQVNPAWLIGFFQHNDEKTVLPLCLVDNGGFTALGIIPNEYELNAFMQNDGRPKAWYIADRSDLTEWLCLARQMQMEQKEETQC